MTTGMNRRAFMGTVAGGVLLSQARAASPNEKIIVGCIGAGGRGRSHMYGLLELDNVEIAWVCDVNEKQIGSMPRQIARRQGRTPKTTRDMREVFDDPEVDAVLIATPDHWHALATIWACQAGKDVYVEKPACNTIWEGQQMVAAARKYNRVVQVGSQNRSGAYTFSAREYIDSGKLGDVNMVKVFNMEDGDPYHMRDNEDAPEYFDWNLFRGPAPMRPFNWDIVQDGGWKRFWETGGGDTSDDGVHQLDVARFLIGDPACPAAVAANGGKIAFNDDGEVPDTLSASYTYDGVLMTFDLTQWAGGMHKIPTESRNTDKFPNWAFTSSRIEVYGTEARMYFGRQGGGWQVLAPDNSVIDEFPGREPTQDHRKNWLECIRTREKPNADIAIGVSSALLAHLPNIAVRLGGAHLQFDADTLTFKDNAAAQDLVHFAYRDGFEVPAAV